MYVVLFLLPVKCTWLFGGTLTVQSKSPIIEHLFQLLKASTFTNMKPDWLVEGHPQAAHLHEISHWSCITLGQFLRVVHGSEFRLFNLFCWFAIPKKQLLHPICFFCSIFPSWCFVLGLASQQKHSKFKTWIHVIAKKSFTSWYCLIWPPSIYIFIMGYELWKASKWLAPELLLLHGHIRWSFLGEVAIDTLGPHHGRIGCHSLPKVGFKELIIIIILLDKLYHI